MHTRCSQDWLMIYEIKKPTYFCIEINLSTVMYGTERVNNSYFMKRFLSREI